VTITSPIQLKRLFMPWYIGKLGTEVAYDDHDAAPMSLADVPKVTDILNEERQADIQQYAEKFRQQEGPVTFAVPTYALPDGRHFVLDRNHRLSALTVAAVPFAVTLWNVKGPLDAECLLDLIHWTPKGNTEGDGAVTGDATPPVSVPTENAN